MIIPQEIQRVRLPHIKQICCPGGIVITGGIGVIIDGVGVMDVGEGVIDVGEGVGNCVGIISSLQQT